jgi:hypothetical protein
LGCKIIDFGGPLIKLLPLTVIFALTLLAGCAYGIRDDDVSQVDPACVKVCKANYSSCVPDEDKAVSITEAITTCKEGYEACIKTCPAK